MRKTCLMCNKVNACKPKSYVVCEINKQWKEGQRSRQEGKHRERREGMRHDAAWLRLSDA